MNRGELLEFHDEVTEDAKSIMKDKNQDYAGDNDPFANFKACEDLGICSTEQGFVVRILDKLKRIITFVQTGKLKVKDEPVYDAVIDIINYLILFAAWLKSQKKLSETEAKH